MIQLSLLLLLLTLQTTIQASDPNELQISTYEEWQAQEAERKEAALKEAALKEAEYAQILEDIREKHMKQRATEEEKKAKEKSKLQEKQRSKTLKDLRINMEWGPQKPQGSYTTSMTGQHGQQTKAAQAKKHPQGKNFGVLGRYICTRCSHTTRDARAMLAHLKGHHNAANK